MTVTASMQTQIAKPKALSNSKHAGMLLQRKCACGSPTASLNGSCPECQSKKMIQTKLAIGASNDPLEQEADRVADQVMAASAHSSVSGAPPRIQRYAKQTTEGTDTAPASVDRVLSSSGRPLEPTLRQDMEQRFGHDFSRVRVHTDATAEQSARDVNAHAYTVGHNMVFGGSQFAPRTHEGRRLIAHELTHVVQQSNSVTASTIERLKSPSEAYVRQAERFAVTRNERGLAGVSAGGIAAARLSVQRQAGAPDKEPDKKNDCSGWQRDPQSISKVAAEHYVRTELELAGGGILGKILRLGGGRSRRMVQSIRCDALASQMPYSCLVHFKGGLVVQVDVSADIIFVTVHTSEPIPPDMLCGGDGRRPGMPLALVRAAAPDCEYKYRCSPSNGLVLTKLGCEINLLDSQKWGIAECPPDY